jgi:hypothetical protein
MQIGEDRDRREALRDQQSLTAAFFGDPLPGMSALDRREAKAAGPGCGTAGRAELREHYVMRILQDCSMIQPFAVGNRKNRILFNQFLAAGNQSVALLIWSRR